MDSDRLSSPSHAAPHGLRHDQRVLLMALLASLPGGVVSLAILWFGDYSPKVQWTLTALIVLVSLGFAFGLRERVVFPLHTLSNLLAGLREGDFSIRARPTPAGDPLGEVLFEVNALVDTLRHQRLDAVEATALLQKVIAETDVAIFTFDDRDRLQLINRAGERLLGQPAERLLARRADELDLAVYLDPATPRVRTVTFPGGVGRWEIRRGIFRQGGRPHQLLLLADVSEPLREEERQAWQRLIRVLGHELNNSLTPIKSIAGSLHATLARPAEDRAPDWQEDLDHGLRIIADRADALSRFMDAYARIARLPAPTIRSIDVESAIRHVASLETRVAVEVVPGPPMQIRADGDQLEQLLINLLRNAADAVQATGGGVRLGWSRVDGQPDTVEMSVDDDGPGIPNTTNLFVPFFTTKAGGTGIGLPLSRQIAEAHGGTLDLRNRPAGGCRAIVRLRIR